MSKDNTVLVGVFQDGYRVINSQACENLSYPEYVYPYFKDAPIIGTEEEALKKAMQMEDEDWSEYGIRKQEFDLPFEVYKWINLGKAVSDAVDNTFPKDVMGAMEYHKNSDGIINFQYNYYTIEWSILHNGYNRGKVLEESDDLSEASYYYCIEIGKKNGEELRNRDRELNEQLPKDYHLKVEGNSYSLYYKGDVNMMGNIREGWFEEVKRRIYEDNI